MAKTPLDFQKQYVVDCNTGDDVMRAVVSISLPEKMASELDKAVKETGRAKSEIVKEALRLYLWEERFRKVRKSLSAKAKKAGVVTDEDVFKIVS